MPQESRLERLRAKAASGEGLVGEAEAGSLFARHMARATGESFPAQPAVAPQPAPQPTSGTQSFPPGMVARELGGVAEEASASFLSNMFGVPAPRILSMPQEMASGKTVQGVLEEEGRARFSIPFARLYSDYGPQEIDALAAQDPELQQVWEGLKAYQKAFDPTSNPAGPSTGRATPASPIGVAPPERLGGMRAPADPTQWYQASPDVDAHMDNVPKRPTDEEMYQQFQGALEAKASGRMMEYAQQHPWLNITTTVGGQLGAFGPAAGLASKAMRVVPGVSALGAAPRATIQAGLATSGIQKLREYGGVQEGFSIPEVVTEMVQGGVAGKLANAARLLARSKGLSEQVAQRIAGSVDLLADSAQEEALTVLDDVMRGDDSTTIMQRLYRMGLFAGGGAVFAKALEATIPATGEATIAGKVAEKVVPQSVKDMVAPKEGPKDRSRLLRDVVENLPEGPLTPIEPTVEAEAGPIAPGEPGLPDATQEGPPRLSGNKASLSKAEVEALVPADQEKVESRVVRLRIEQPAWGVQVRHDAKWKTVKRDMTEAEAKAYDPEAGEGASAAETSQVQPDVPSLGAEAAPVSSLLDAWGPNPDPKVEEDQLVRGYTSMHPDAKFYDRDTVLQIIEVKRAAAEKAISSGKPKDLPRLIAEELAARDLPPDPPKLGAEAAPVAPPKPEAPAARGKPKPDLGVYSDYDQAYEGAQRALKKLGNNVGVGIEKRKEYGKTVFTVKLVPKDPSKRFGHELRMEIVEPTPRMVRGEAAPAHPAESAIRALIPQPMKTLLLGFEYGASATSATAAKKALTSATAAKKALKSTHGRVAKLATEVADGIIADQDRSPAAVRSLEALSQAAYHLRSISQAKTPKAAAKALGKAHDAVTASMQDMLGSPRNRALRRRMSGVLQSITKSLEAIPDPANLKRGSRQAKAATLVDISTHATYDGKAMKPETVAQQIESGELRVKRVRYDLKGDMAIVTIKGGKDLILHGPDSRGRWHDLAKVLSAKERGGMRVSEKLTKEQAHELALKQMADIVEMQRVDLPQFAVKAFSSLFKPLDIYRSKVTGEPSNIVGGMEKFFRNFGGIYRSAEYQQLSAEQRSRLFAEIASAKKLELDLRLLLDFPGGPELSRLMDKAMEQNVEFMDDGFFPSEKITKARELIERLHDIYERAGKTFVDSGLMTSETFEKHRRKYRHRSFPQKMRSKLAYRSAYREMAAKVQVLDPSSIRGVMGHFKGRKLTETEYETAGGNLDIMKALDGAIKQLFAANQLELYNRIAEVEGLVYQSKEDLPPQEVDLVDEYERLSKSTKRLTKWMAKNKVPLDRKWPQDPEEAGKRGSAGMQLVRHRQKMKEEGLPEHGPYEGASADVRKRIKKARIRLKGLITKTYGHSDLNRIPELPRGTGPYSETIARVNMQYAQMVERMHELAQSLMEYSQVPDEKEYGALRNTYVRNDVWNEMRAVTKEPHGIFRVYDSVHMMLKRNLTSRRLATGMKNVLGNIPYNSLAGQQVWHPDALKQTATAWQHIRKAYFKGEIANDPVLQRFIDTGIMTATAHMTELKNFLGETPDQAFAAGLAALEKGDINGVEHVANALTLVVEKLPSMVPLKVGKALDAVDAWYQISDLVQAYSLYRSLTLNKASTWGRELPHEHAMYLIDAWYNYQDVPRPVRSRWGRRGPSFLRFQVKALTGVPLNLFTGPVSIIPGMKPWTPKAGRSADPTKRKMASLAAGSAAAMLRMLKLYGTYQIMGAAAKSWSGMDDEEYEQRKFAAAYGDEWRAMFMMPIWWGDRRDDITFVDLYGLSPWSHFPSIFSSKNTASPAGFGPVKSRLLNPAFWFQTMADSNVISAKVKMFFTEEDFFGNQMEGNQLIYRTIFQPLIPGLYSHPAELIKRAFFTEDSILTPGTAFFDFLGLRVRPGKYENVPRGMVYYYVNKGILKKSGGSYMLTGEGNLMERMSAMNWHRRMQNDPRLKKRRAKRSYERGKADAEEARSITEGTGKSLSQIAEEAGVK